jgi:NADPH-dependent glutamate synthase beta subunit-like oxidoreductase
MQQSTKHSGRNGTQWWILMQATQHGEELQCDVNSRHDAMTSHNATGDASQRWGDTTQQNAMTRCNAIDDATGHHDEMQRRDTAIKQSKPMQQMMWCNACNEEKWRHDKMWSRIEYDKRTRRNEEEETWRHDDMWRRIEYDKRQR